MGKRVHNGDRGHGERRRFQRFRFKSVARLSKDSAERDCNLVDMSLKGVLLKCPTDMALAPGEQCRLELRLAGAIKITLKMVVVRVEGGYFAACWDALDEDTLENLKRLIEINLDDPALATREIEALK